MELVQVGQLHPISIVGLTILGNAGDVAGPLRPNYPTTAENLGIKDGALVSIEVDMEAFTQELGFITECGQPDFIPIDGERQPFQMEFGEFLTDKTQRDPISEQTNLKSLLCRVKPI